MGFGFFLALIGLTGSVLVFWQEIDQALNPELYVSKSVSAGSPRSLDELFAAAIASAPPGWMSAYTDIPEQTGGNYLFHFYYETPSEQTENAESLNIAVDPYSAQVVAHRLFYHAWNPLQHSLLGFFFKLHYALFLGQTGIGLVGGISIDFHFNRLDFVVAVDRELAKGHDDQAPGQRRAIQP